MADTKSFFLKQIDSVLDRYAPAEMSLKRTEGSASIFNFCSAALTTISRIAGGDSYYAEQAEDFRNVQDYEAIQALLGILQALREDVQNDFLETINERIHGEVFTDFLDMGEYLLKENFKDAAAVMIGGVLESHLRQLCMKHQISVEKAGGNAKKASELNSELYKKSIYSLTDQKLVTAWLDIRNKAAHALYNDYSREHVDQFLLGIRSFISRYPA